MSARRLTCFALAVFSLSAGAQTPEWLDTNIPAQQRAQALVGQMTLDEKAAQLEDWATAIPRLGVPDYQTWNEALHGVARAGYATVFPQAIGMAATWDTDRWCAAMGDIISAEARAKYNQAQREGNHRIFYGLTFWSPNINIFRDPRWGRGQETYGEDPFLTGRLGVAFVTGVQGPDPDHLRAVATSKHFAVHSGPEPLRHGFNVDPSRARSRRDLPAGISRHRHRRACAVGDVRLQLDRRLAGLRQQHAARRSPARRLGIQGLRRLRLRRDRRREPGPQEDRRTSSTPRRSHWQAGTDLSCSIWAPGFNYARRSAVRHGLVAEDAGDAGSAERLYTARISLGLFDPPGSSPLDGLPLSDAACWTRTGRSRWKAAERVDRAAQEQRCPAAQPRAREDRGHRTHGRPACLRSSATTSARPCSLSRRSTACVKQFRGSTILYAQGSTLAEGVGGARAAYRLRHRPGAEDRVLRERRLDGPAGRRHTEPAVSDRLGERAARAGRRDRQLLRALERRHQRARGRALRLLARVGRQLPVFAGRELPAAHRRQGRVRGQPARQGSTSVAMGNFHADPGASPRRRR